MDRNFLLAMALSLAVVVTWTMYTDGKKQQYLAENPPEIEMPLEAGESAMEADKSFDSPTPTPVSPTAEASADRPARKRHS